MKFSLFDLEWACVHVFFRRFKIIYLWNRSSELRTIFTLMFLVSKSLKLDHMLISFNKVFCTFKNNMVLPRVLRV